MAELPPGGLEVAAEVAAIASGPGSVRQRAEELLRPLHKLVPFCLGRISMPDPDVRDRQLLISSGPTAAFSAYFDSPAVVNDIERIGIDRPHPPMRLDELPVPAHELIGWTDYFWPAGLKDGLAVGLFAPDGRHLAIVSLYTDSPGHPSAAARDLIGSLTPVLARALDPLRSLTIAARLVRDAHAATALTRDGSTVPLPGLPTDPLLRHGSPVLAVAAARVAAGLPYTSFLAPNGGAGGGHQRVTVLACPAEPPLYLTAVVVLSRAGDLADLTRRELEVLGLLTEGWPDERIAASLTITRRTVASHVEHILAKLGVRNRTAAAVHCLRTGLYVPRELLDAAGGWQPRRPCGRRRTES